AEPFRFPEGKHGKGELKYRNGLPVLVLEGTPKEIGEQEALLAVKPGSRILDYPEDVLHGFLHSPDKGTLYKFMWGYFAQTAEKMVKVFPDDYKIELDSMIE